MERLAILGKLLLRGAGWLVHEETFYLEKSFFSTNISHHFKVLGGFTNWSLTNPAVSEAQEA